MSIVTSLLAKLFKRSAGDPSTSGVSGGKVTAIIALIVNTIVGALKLYFGQDFDVPPDILAYVNTALAALYAWFLRRSIDPQP